MATAEKASEFVALSAIYHLVVPFLLAVVFGSGLIVAGLFTVEEKSTKNIEHIMSWCLGGIGVLGTGATIFAIRYLRRRPANWQLFHLGRGSWIFLFSLAWLAGVACGIFIFNG